MDSGCFPDGAQITGVRRCRVCNCSDGDRCWEERQLAHPIFKRVKRMWRRFCEWVAPDLCSFCAADGGPPEVSKLPQGPEHFSPILNVHGERYRWSKDLPR